MTNCSHQWRLLKKCTNCEMVYYLPDDFGSCKTEEKPEVKFATCDGKKFPYEGRPHITPEMVAYAEEKLNSKPETKQNALCAKCRSNAPNLGNHLCSACRSSPLPEKNCYTKAEIDEKLRKVIEIGKRGDNISAQCGEMIYVDKAEEREWRKALLDELASHKHDDNSWRQAINSLRSRFL